MKNINYRYVISFLFIFIILFLFAASNPVNVLKQLGYAFIDSVFDHSNENPIAEFISGYSNDHIVSKRMINISGSIQKLTANKAIYNSENIYLCDDQYIVSAGKLTSSDYEYEQLCMLKEELSKHDIPLLYVNAPTKYLDDKYLSDEFGVESFVNKNADKLLDRISKKEIDYVDLRENVKKENKDIKKMFYKADHHWNVDSGLWASGIIAETLNDKYDFSIDMSLLDPSNFDKTQLDSCWLGEQGQMLGSTNSCYDDFVIIRPKYDTNYRILYLGKEQKGTFDNVFINYEAINSNLQKYNYSSFHYMYYNYSNIDISVINENVSDGKILLISDSFSHVLTPFLSTCVNEITTFDLRYINDEPLSDYLDKIYDNYDVVIICYTPYMIGAHDDKESFNRSTFNFFNVEK